jgi:hypothetical protein
MGTVELYRVQSHLNDYSIGYEQMAIGTEAKMQSMMSKNHYGKISKEHIGFTEAQYKSHYLFLNDI